MEIIKTDKDLTFTVNYSDGAKKEVKEGIMFEVDEGKLIMHNGTNNAYVLFAAAKSAMQLISAAGLGDRFKEFLDKYEESEETEKA